MFLENSQNKEISDRIYFVSSDSDDTVLIGIDVEIDLDQKEVHWFDTVKDRLMEFESLVDNDPAHIVFKRAKSGWIYTFVPLTLEIYNAKIKNKLLIPQEFADEEKMLNALRETIQNAW